MKRIFLLALTLLLVSCSNLKDVADNLKYMVKPLAIAEFCEMRNKNLTKAKGIFSEKLYYFYGVINAIDKKSNHTVIGINDIDDGGLIYAKVYNYSNQAKGEKIKIRGKISVSNFNESNIKHCRILVDDGIIMML